jgi:hypothetical protein
VFKLTSPLSSIPKVVSIEKNTIVEEDDPSKYWLISPDDVNNYVGTYIVSFFLFLLLLLPLIKKDETTVR